MSHLFVLSFFLSLFYPKASQENLEIRGAIWSSREKKPLVNAIVQLEGFETTTTTKYDGTFQFQGLTNGDFVLNISLDDFVTKRIPVTLKEQVLDLGNIYMERDISIEQTDNLITLTDAELFDDEISSSSSGLLQATKDIFLSRAAFDFGQAFFRVRGYDAQNGKILLNGIPMNKFYDGRPQWNNWGGLNDATRNQLFTQGLQPSLYSFGGILGTTNIDTRPSGLRPGTRVSSSASNRTYAGRFMVTHTSALSKDGLAYSLSASRRWAKQGYINGTLYDAYSVYAALEYKFNTMHSLQFSGIYASNRRGRSSALTEEVYELVGNQYNPYWGEQNEQIRNSRERKIAEPILMLNHLYESDAFRLNTGLSYQFGTNNRSRLGYYNSPNPDPTYYRYLPSFYINSSIGANFISANTAKENFIANPQLNWNSIYQANKNEKAVYVLYDDVTNDRQLVVNTSGNLEINKISSFDFGLAYSKLTSNNFAKINDLLGATFHEDIDPFSNTVNDIDGNIFKQKDDIFNYHYNLNASQFEVFSQLKINKNSWEAFLTGNYTNTKFQRKGLFRNERFLEDSFGNSRAVSLSNFGLKTGFTYHLNGRHSVNLNAALLKRPPVLQNVFINPRENNQEVPNIQNEKISAMDLNYYLRLPKLIGRVTGYYTRFQDATDINFFFVDSGVGSDFVQEVITDLDKLHLGLEIGFEYQLSSTVQLTGVAALGRFVYASNPLVSINFDTAGAEEDLIDPMGRVNLGPSYIKDYKLAQGPQQAYALGINYRDPKYWWIGVTANYLTKNYANISSITRTESFYLDPETGTPFPDATEENVQNLLNQKPLDSFYLLNFVGGKSWLKNGKYISIFASINNAFDTVFRTGGYEQSRNGNFGQLRDDSLSGSPSFAPKYWYGYGRTYFLNIAYSF